MKHFILSLLVIGAFSFTISSCGNKSKSAASTEVVDKTGKEYTSVYVCPMHCKGSGSDKASGTCPVCKMDYVINKDHKGHSGGHNHGSHEGHNHGSHEGHDHGSHEGHNHGSHEGHDHGSHEGHNH